MALASKEYSDTLKTTFGLDAAKTMSAPLGAFSPLWLAFGAAASAGVAYWWLTRWMRPTNLEAAGEAAVEVALAVEPPPVSVVEATPLVVAETLVEAVPPVQTVIEPSVVAEPAVPEPAVVEVAPEPPVTELPVKKVAAKAAKPKAVELAPEMTTPVKAKSAKSGAKAKSKAAATPKAI